MSKKSFTKEKKGREEEWTWEETPEVTEDNIVNKTEIKIGLRQEGNIEILSGLNIGDIIVAEGLKKVFPRSKIKPIKN